MDIMTTIYIPSSDAGFNLAFTIKSADGNVYNLTGYTIKLKVWRVGQPGLLLLNGSCDIDSAPDGTCHYTITASDFTSVGTFKAELELTKAGVIESTKTFGIEVMESG